MRCSGSLLSACLVGRTTQNRGNCRATERHAHNVANATVPTTEPTTVPTTMPTRLNILQMFSGVSSVPFAHSLTYEATVSLSFTHFTTQQTTHSLTHSNCSLSRPFTHLLTHQLTRISLHSSLPHSLPHVVEVNVREHGSNAHLSALSLLRHAAEQPIQN